MSNPEKETPTPNSLRRTLLTGGSSAVLGAGVGFALSASASAQTPAMDDVAQARITIGDNARSIQDKLSETVSVRDFGARGDGRSDDTRALRKALEHAAKNKIMIELEDRDYLVSGLLLYSKEATSVGMVCRAGRARIQVADGLHEKLITLNDAEDVLLQNIEIDGNDRVAKAIDIRSRDGGGNVSLSGITVRGMKKTTQSSQASGILVGGEFDTVSIRNCLVDGVTRDGKGDCKGIAVANMSGLVAIDNCHVANILAPQDDLIDADGIAVFGRSDVGPADDDPGLALIENCTVRNVSGRFIKSQLGGTVVRSNRFIIDDNIALIQNFRGVDFQRGHGICRDNLFLMGKFSGADSGCYIQFQNKAQQPEMFSVAENNNIVSTQRMPYFCVPIAENNRNMVRIVGNSCGPVKFVIRCGGAAGAFASHHIIARENSADVSAAFFGTIKTENFGDSLLLEFSDNRNLSARGNQGLVWYKAPFSIGHSFRFGPNPGYDVRVDWSFDFDRLAPGNSFVTGEQLNDNAPERIGRRYSVVSDNGKQTVCSDSREYRRINSGQWQKWF